MPARQRIRKALLLFSLLVFPITLYCFSPALILQGAAEGIVNASAIVFGLMFLSALFFGRLWCGCACPAGDTDAAVESYTELATQFPDSDLAPETLWQAARIRQGEGAYAEAAGLYETLAHDFSGYEDADAVLWYAGLARYRADEVEEAMANWQTLVDNYPDSIYGPKTHYWLGKVGAEPEDANAFGYWEQLIGEIPHTYYALRVQEVDAGQSLTLTRLITTPVESPPWGWSPVSGRGSALAKRVDRSSHRYRVTHLAADRHARIRSLQRSALAPGGTQRPGTGSF